jgi:Tfp pilus assembly protein PilF
LAEKAAWQSRCFREPLRKDQTRILRRLGTLLAYLIALVALAARAQTNNSGASAREVSLIIEAAGSVECTTGGNTNWRVAPVGTALLPGDRVRTHEQSRAAVQLSDRSVVRLNERTTLEVLPPKRAEKRRFGLPRGALYFFDREKPADIEFDTPLAAGAIRGTEFLLEVAETNSALRVALIDGSVALQWANGEISMDAGQDLYLAVGQPPRKTALLNVNGAIQWALYYPAVLNPADVSLTSSERENLKGVLEEYYSGDLLAVLAHWPTNVATPSPGATLLHAALKLSVGEVADAERLLSNLPSDAPGAAALRELIAMVRGETLTAARAPRNASEWLARSYALQAATDLPHAREAARQSVTLAPDFGFSHARLAELDFAFGANRAALNELNQALKLSPRLAPAHALRGFVLLEQGDVRSALAAFDHARRIDAAFAPAWLGRGLCSLREREFAEARASFQTAAALEPQRALFRSYLGKASSELGDARAAEKEFALAKQLDSDDPTGWLYSALHLWQQNRINEAIRDLEQAKDVNDSRAPFRSRLLLDRDRSVASADLAAIYADAGLNEVSRHTAQQAVAEEYANFSGHLFLANSLRSLEDINHFNLRFETARESELLVANLLAPPGAGNLSQHLSQQEHLQFFDPRPIGMSSLTEYDSHGDWRQIGSVFGTVGGLSYAVDANYQSLNGWQPNGQSELGEYTLTMKQRITTDDELYLQVGVLESNAGDVANHYDPAQALPGFHVEERQEPTLFAGWHHTWAPGSHTLLLLGRLDDHLSLHNPDLGILFLQTDLFGNGIIGVQQGPLPPPPTGQGPVTLDFSSDFTLYSAELQQIFETPRFTLVLGGRWQSGDESTHALMKDNFLGTPQVATDEHVSGNLERGDVYAYGSYRVFDRLQLLGGVNYDHLTAPQNQDIPPLTDNHISRDLVSPKAGLLLEPWDKGLVRASYTKSLGGLYFDNSVRLEPTQVGGFNQAFRSLIPESVVGLVPGTEFETIGFGFDQSLPSGTWFGIETEQLKSNGEREVGAFKFFTEVLTDATASGTRQTLDFRERSVSAYAAQLLGDNLALAARYRVSEAKLTGRFPDIPNTAVGLSELEQNNRATLHQLSLTANFNHRSGFFAQWESVWYYQLNSGYSPALQNADFWQHNIFAGYRFRRRYAEIRLGLLNLTDTDYRLNPLNLYGNLPRGRTFTSSLRLNF